MVGIKHIVTGVASLALLSGCGHAASLGANVNAGHGAGALGAPGLQEDVAPPAGLMVTVPSHPLRSAPTVSHGNRADLSVGTAETYPAITGFINGAQKTLWIEMFEFGGTYAAKLVPLLVARAKAGVQVKLLVDQAGSQISPKGLRPYEQQLREAGVDLHFYPARLRRDGFHWRFNITHRKLLVADQTVAMEGGTNFGTSFENTTHDLMVKWHGPVVQDLYKEFTTEWKFVTKETLAVPPAPAPAGDVDAQVAVTSVPEGRFEIRDAVFKAIDNAQHEVRLEQQYIWEDDLEKHLMGAVKRGVKVRIMIPGGTKENVVLGSLNNETLHRLVQAGAEARAYVNPVTPVSHLHVKHYSVDDNWVATGSCNGDARSLVDHQELDVLSTSPAFVQEVRTRLFERDWAQASQPWVYKTGGAMKPFRGLLELLDYLF